jgi:hypothetical protein
MTRDQYRSTHLHDHLVFRRTTILEDGSGILAQR